MFRRLWAFGAALVMWGCATQAPQATPSPAAPAPSAANSQLPHYRCDGGLEFDVRFGDDSAELSFPARPAQTLLRDAGGTSPQQVVYSNTDAKVEFGLGAGGREAKLNFVSPAIEARCIRD